MQDDRAGAGVDAAMLGRLLKDWWRRLAGRAGSAGEALALYREGVALGEANRNAEAAERYRRALGIDPGLAEAYNNLGRIHEMNARNEEAAECYRRAIVCKPELPHPYINLGNMLMRNYDLDGAYRNYEAALKHDPAMWVAHNNRANILLHRGEHAAARAAFSAAIALSPDDPVAASNKLNCDVEALAAKPREQFQEYLEWGRRFAEPLLPASLRHANASGANRRLRLGYVSPDFRKHAMGYFIEPMLEHCDAAAFEVVCYNNFAQADSMTARFKSLAHQWRDVAELADQELAQLIVDDGIDLLVDLAGHSSDNRLLVFARKPAPVQFTYLGYPNTTGVRAIDYRITDAYADPPGLTEAYYVERLLRLPHCMWCYRAPDYAPDVGPLPAVANGFITFGSFNSFMKVTDGVIDAWARLLALVPGSRLLMATVAEGAAQARARDTFAARGIGADRLQLVPRMMADAYFELRNRVDIALDPFPVNGGTTTCDTLWMGVPTVTLAGSVFVARAGVSLLTNLGLPELVAADLDGYIDIAAGLAADLPRLQALRAGLRERMRASPLCDAPRFVRNLERLYRDAWIAWCGGNIAGVAAPSPALPLEAP
jgi:predicted O-linked N-acetylglucosamine transferase (SPINDLY family)